MVSANSAIRLMVLPSLDLWEAVLGRRIALDLIEKISQRAEEQTQVEQSNRKAEEQNSGTVELGIRYEVRSTRYEVLSIRY